MALPPNWLTVLFYGREDFPYPGVPEAPRTPEGMWTMPKEEGCLSEEGLKNPDGLVQLIRATQQRYEERVEAHPGETGPNEVDWIAEALIGSPYLNDEAHRRYDTPFNPEGFPNT
jgi:hypothetical protein